MLKLQGDSDAIVAPRPIRQLFVQCLWPLSQNERAHEASGQTEQEKTSNFIISHHFMRFCSKFVLLF